MKSGDAKQILSLEKGIQCKLCKKWQTADFKGTNRNPSAERIKNRNNQGRQLEK
jgi:hypothetical protein